MRKTALLTGVAGLFLMTAPAFAQDGTAPQTPPPATATPPAAAQPAPAQPPAATPPAAEQQQPQSLTLQPGADVKGSDGTVLGQLEGARNSAAGQELTVRGADGQLRAVPVSAGVRQEGAGVAVGWTSAQFSAAPSITDATTDVAEPEAPPMPDQPDAPPAPDQPDAAPPVPAPTPPTLPAPTDPSNPAPDEDGETQPDQPGA
ncbi:MAG: superoxide dismutase [Brevundimonas sp.]|nr:MAG: superoxide dismutase [Brevundimonas sp.]